MISIINIPPVVCLSDSPAILEVETNIATGENLHVVVEPKYWNRGEAIGSDVLYPPFEGRASCDLSEYLRSIFGEQAAVSEWFMFPDTGVSRMVENLSMRYSIKIKEGIGFPTVYTDTDIPDRFVVPGKIPKWMRNKFYGTYYSFLDWILTVHPFLTLQPDFQQTTIAQTRKLYWMMWYDPATEHKLKIKVQMEFTDGTTGSWLKSTVPEEDWYQYAIYEIPAGYTSLGIQAIVDADHAGKTVASYSVTMTADADAAVSETRTFIVDRNQHEAEREFVFRNSVGGYDLIMLTGTLEAQRDHTNETVNVNNAAHGLPMKRTVFSDFTETIKVNTGWLTPAQRLYMSELLESPDIYEITANGLMPVVIAKQSMIPEKDNDTLISLQIEFERVVNYYYESGT